MTEKAPWDMTDEELDAMVDQEIKEIHGIHRLLDRCLFGMVGKVRTTGWDATKKGKVIITYEQRP